MELNQTTLLRLAAFIVDTLSLSLLLVIPATLVSYSIVFLGGSLKSVSFVWYAAMLVVIIGILLRDGYRGRSPGKRLLGLQLHTRVNRPCGYVRSVARNLPLLIPGINLVEIALILFTRQSRRAGDRIAGTTVVEE